MNDTDIVKQHDQLINELKAELERKNKYLSLIAHDFKGLFSNILWVLDALESGIITEQEFKSMLPEIKQHAQINLNTINDTFTWVNAQMFEEKLLLTDVNIYNLVSQLKTSLQQSIIGKDISISYLGDPSFVFQSNAVLLRFVLKKLIENAIKYSFINGVVEIGTEIRETHLYLFIKDRGTGISKEKLTTIFTMNDVKYLGTEGEKGGGISLVIVNDFVKMMNGKIKMYPNDGNKGTVVELIFAFD